MCQCNPSTNQVCQGQGNYGMTQPTCQILPDNTTNVNPYFDTSSNISYWTYKVYEDCDGFRDITDIYIPVYENIASGMLTIFERILSCGRFEAVSYDFANPSGITPPAGFNFVHIPVNSRYANGVAVIYRLQIVGDFPTTQQTLYMDTEGGLLTFSAGYLVPSEPANPRLTVTKDSVVTINGDQASIDYTVGVTNTGNVDLDDVMLTDVITYNSVSTILGTITVNPPSINVDTTVPGMIRLTGNLGTILMGATATVTYAVPIDEFLLADSYAFSSSTTAMNAEAQASFESMATVPVVGIDTQVNCMLQSTNTGAYQVVLINQQNSPTTSISYLFSIPLDNEITLRFIDFGSCTATFENSGQTVPVNTDINSNDTVNISCELTLSSNGSSNLLFPIRIVSSTGTLVQLVGTLTSVALQVTNEQVFLGATPLPVSAQLDITVDAECMGTCS